MDAQSPPRGKSGSNYGPTDQFLSFEKAIKVSLHNLFQLKWSSSQKLDLQAC